MAWAHGHDTMRRKSNRLAENLAVKQNRACERKGKRQTRCSGESHADSKPGRVGPGRLVMEGEKKTENGDPSISSHL
jgi:hypothetical protein